MYGYDVLFSYEENDINLYHTCHRYKNQSMWKRQLSLQNTAKTTRMSSKYRSI